ncbi:MAG: M15 family metallopeptidase [Ginsengibacter sp.]
MNIFIMPVISIVFAYTSVSGQANFGNKYGLNVVNNIKLLESEIEADSNKLMVDVKKAIPDLILDLRYTTRNNFMHQRLYQLTRTTYLRLPAVIALKKITAELHSKNLSIKIFDAYRPYSVTEQMWEQVKDNRYAADPARGSGHNRGTAVDLTLVNLLTKKELPMGTGFDNFSDTAHMDFEQLPPGVLQNRRFLKSIMEKYGFESLDTEWWHFSLPAANSYELLNLSFDALKKLNEQNFNAK